MAGAVEAAVAANGWPVATAHCGSMFTVFFTGRQVDNWGDAATCDTAAFGRFFHAMLDRGFHLPPAQFEAWFLGAAHGEAEFAALTEATTASLADALAG
jgi:glutamate-1-semialdehyde 2,1-aminomutase